MIKQQVRYEDFDGIQQEETLYFNLNRMELIALQARYGKDDMAKYIEKVQAEEDYQKMYDLLNDIVLTSYGVRSEDGKRFIKNDQVREDFKTSLAYEALIEDFHDDEGVTLNKFITGITSHIRGLKEAAASAADPAAQ